MPRLLQYVKLKCVECDNEWSHNRSELQSMSGIEPTAHNIITILPELSCPECFEPRLFLYDDSNQLLIDPNNITLCSYGDCDNPIPLPRFSTFEDTNVCGIDHEEIVQTTATTSTDITEPAETDDEALMGRLISLRNILARRRGVPRYHVFSKRTLRQIVSQKPTNEEELLRIYGIGPERVRLHAGHLMDVMRDFVDLNGHEHNSPEEDLSIQEVAQKLAQLTLQKVSIETEINKYRRVLCEERLSEPERIDTQDSSRVSITPQPANFTASAKREIQENQLEIISDDILSELVSRGYIREVRSLLVNEEKINELPEMERSVLFDQGIINVELQRKTVRPNRDDIDDAFIQEMLDAGVFGVQPNHVRFLP